jgi:hypothetical protein
MGERQSVDALAQTVLCEFDPEELGYLAVVQDADWSQRGSLSRPSGGMGRLD